MMSKKNRRKIKAKIRRRNKQKRMKINKETIRVAVYGTLMRGFGLHTYLKNTKYIGTFQTEPEYTMYSMGGSYPYIIKGNGNTSITMEVYEFTEKNILRSLDGAEGVDENNPKDALYNRVEIYTPFGKAFVYTRTEKFYPEHLPILSGSWSEFKEVDNADKLYM